MAVRALKSASAAARVVLRPVRPRCSPVRDFPGAAAAAALYLSTAAADRTCSFFRHCSTFRKGSALSLIGPAEERDELEREGRVEPTTNGIALAPGAAREVIQRRLMDRAGR